MTSDLVHRLRTCAAAIVAVDPKNGWVALISDDAANLLMEASNVLDAAEPLGEPMAILEPIPTSHPVKAAVWTTDMPVRLVDMPDIDKPRVCPGCHHHTASIVNRVDRRLWLTCQECAYRWEYVA